MTADTATEEWTEEQTQGLKNGQLDSRAAHFGEEDADTLSLEWSWSGQTAAYLIDSSPCSETPQLTAVH